MKPRICICCGELMAEHGNALSRNPNLCASCSSMADGMGDNPASFTSLPESSSQLPDLEVSTVPAEAGSVTLELVSQRVPLAP